MNDVDKLNEFLVACEGEPGILAPAAKDNVRAGVALVSLTAELSDTNINGDQSCILRKEQSCIQQCISGELYTVEESPRKYMPHVPVTRMACINALAAGLAVFCLSRALPVAPALETSNTSAISFLLTIPTCLLNHCRCSFK